MTTEKKVTIVTGASKGIGAGIAKALAAESYAVVVNYPGFSIYSATKAALESLTKVWAHELGKKNIRINAILPGMVDTEGTRAFVRPGSEAEQIWIARTPLGRTRYPDIISPLALFLAS